MTSDPHTQLRRFAQLLRPSPWSIAAAAASYDPALLLQLAATQREPA